MVKMKSFSSSHTALQLNWTGSLWSCSFLSQPKDRAGLTMPSSTVNGERVSCNSWKCFFFFFYRHEEQTGHQSSAVHPMSCVTWRRTLLILEEHSCSGHTHLHVLVISITKPFTLKDKISFAYSIGADNCLSSNWALGSTITLRKQWEAYQQGNSFPLLWPEKQ